MTLYARDHLGRPLTALEQAVADEEQRDLNRRAELHRLWLAEQSDRSRRLMNLGPRPTDNEKHAIRRTCDAASDTTKFGVGPCRYPACSCHGQLEKLREAP